MKRFGQICEISLENAEKYIQYHKNVPLEIKKLIWDCNIRNYRIFYRKGILFTYYDYIGQDYEKDMLKMSENEDNKKWWNLVKPLMSPLPDREEGEFWADMQLIFEQE